jgi:tRNA (guanine26-N2/guanine27-N2)-dimethyltransferase
MEHRSKMVEASFKTDFPTETIKEGNVKVIVPKLTAFATTPSDYAPSKAPVFYNPVMELNRDIAILAFQVQQRMAKRLISVCEPLTSSGIRAIRFATEIQGVKKIIIGDINEQALKLANMNVRLNKLEGRIDVEHIDANCLMSCHDAPRLRFDIVDIDPFGSPVPYLDSAVRAIRNNGILAATATDLAPLCGVHKKACLRKYGGKPLRTEYCHELAIRLLAGVMAVIAAKHEIGIQIVLSHSTAHYIRVYAKINYGAKKADSNIENLGYILHCFHCFHREILTKLSCKLFEICPKCGHKMDWSGPLWVGKIFNRQFCSFMIRENRHRALRKTREIAKLLSLLKHEAEGPATYFVLDHLSDKLSLPVPSLSIMLQKLRDKGFQAYPTHFNSRGIRTDAPALAMKELLQTAISNA